MIAPDIRRAFFVSVLVLVAHLVGIGLYWYWTIWWYDIFMHIFGGFLIAVLAELVMRRLGVRVSAASIVLAVIIVGIGWEVFEFVKGVTGTTPGQYWTDTLTDLVCDIVGAYVGYRFVTKNRQLN